MKLLILLFQHQAADGPYEFNKKGLSCQIRLFISSIQIACNGDADVNKSYLFFFVMHAESN